MFEGPVSINNTHSVGAVHEGAIEWRVEQGASDSGGFWWSLPIIAETWDGYLNDINGFHVRKEHAKAALAGAKTGPVQEGNVGGGTGMICHSFKCGIGTSSRIVETVDGKFTVGVLVQANYGSRETLRVAGVPVGKYYNSDMAFDEAGTPEKDIINALVAGKDMMGTQGRTVKAISHEKLQQIMQQHNRLEQ